MSCLHPLSPLGTATQTANAHIFLPFVCFVLIVLRPTTVNCLNCIQKQSFMPSSTAVSQSRGVTQKNKKRTENPKGKAQVKSWTETHSRVISEANQRSEHPIGCHCLFWSEFKSLRRVVVLQF